MDAGYSGDETERTGVSRSKWKVKKSGTKPSRMGYKMF
jgi:hypothetical protein